jgi:hypothetical protein
MRRARDAAYRVGAQHDQATCSAAELGEWELDAPQRRHAATGRSARTGADRSVVHEWDG